MKFWTHKPSDGELHQPRCLAHALNVEQVCRVVCPVPWRYSHGTANKRRRRRKREASARQRQCALSTSQSPVSLSSYLVFALRWSLSLHFCRNSFVIGGQKIKSNKKKGSKKKISFFFFKKEEILGQSVLESNREKWLNWKILIIDLKRFDLMTSWLWFCHEYLSSELETGSNWSIWHL